jgi:hypothetical protein
MVFNPMSCTLDVNEALEYTFAKLIKYHSIKTYVWIVGKAPAFFSSSQNIMSGGELHSAAVLLPEKYSRALPEWAL